MTHPRQDAIPLVTVLTPTRDRPHFLPILLRCFREQTYPLRELIVLDDGEQPADAGPVQAAGGNLIRLEPGTPVGTKLNLAISIARGSLVQRMDDDDYYASDFLERTVKLMQTSREDLCRPTIAGMGDHSFFNIARWELRHSPWKDIGGPTLLLQRIDAMDHPFRPVTSTEDTWIKNEFRKLGGVEVRVPAERSFFQVRHGRRHGWEHLSGGRTIEQAMMKWKPDERTPEEVFPEWALAAYREIQEELPRDD